MTNNRILRAPDVSRDAVTINSAYEEKSISEDEESNPLVESLQETLNVAEEVREEIEPVAVHETERKDLEISELEIFSNQLDEKERELHNLQESLKQEESRLEDEKKSYKAEIYEQLRRDISVELNAEYNEKKEQLAQLLNSLSEKLDTDIQGAEDELISVVFESVCKIIGSHMRESKNVISVVREVMKHTQDRMEMKLRVSQNDYEILHDVKEELNIGVRNRIDIISDEHVRYGGCILETDAGRIDGRLEQQLNSLMQLLLNGKD